LGEVIELCLIMCGFCIELIIFSEVNRNKGFVYLVRLTNSIFRQGYTNQRNDFHEVNRLRLTAMVADMRPLFFELRASLISF
jgi:hypothetical protein